MKTKILLILTLILVGCGEKSTSELTVVQQAKITTGAGMLARNLTYLPGDSAWSEIPSEQYMADLVLIAEEHTEVWPIFFRAAADTAMKIEQLEMQLQQEARLQEML